MTEELNKTITENGVISHSDGTRETENKHFRLINLPKLNFRVSSKGYEPIDETIEQNIKKIFELYCVEDHAKPQEIINALKSIDFHKEHKDIYQVLENFNLQCQIEGKESVTFPKFMNYLNEHLADYSNWQNCGNVFNSITDKDLLKSKGVNEITNESLFKVLEEIGIDDLSKDDITYIMNFVCNGQDPNITQDEFYYLMTKRPIEYDALVGITKSFKKEK